MHRHALAQCLQRVRSPDAMPKSIDEVVQNGLSKPDSPPPPVEQLANMSISRTKPLPPLGPEISLRERASSATRSPPPPPIRTDRTQGSSVGRAGSRQAAGKENDGATLHSQSGTLNGLGTGMNITDFFSAEVFNLVLHNPTTAHRFLRFCQSRACGEHMEFLQKVERYTRLLDEVSQTLASVQSTYIAPEAPRQINISSQLAKSLSASIRYSTYNLLPSLEDIFTPAREGIQKQLSADMYPRFVKHQVTAQATMALAEHREKFAGLGDCFCLTDPNIADNPIVFASDGFVSVTGYSRKDIIPRNCRFLQGDLTDHVATKRLRAAIDSCEETVELLLNYRKNGDPFWNLLYCSPLFNSRGEISFFLGGQINCSTTIHSYTDVLRVLSFNEEAEEANDASARSIRSQASGNRGEANTRSNFFKSWRKYQAIHHPGMKKINVRDEPGMENELVDQLGKLNFQTQIEAFYTAYSKYLVMNWNLITRELLIQHYSTGIIDMLGLNLPNGGTVPIFGKDIFKVLLEHSSPSSSVARAVRGTVIGALKELRPVSVEVGLLTGLEERKKKSGFFSSGGGGARGETDGWKRREERFVTHWTPCKDEEGTVKWVVLTIAPKF